MPRSPRPRSAPPPPPESRLTGAARTGLLLALAILPAARAGADEALCLDGPRETVRIATAVSGDELRLADGRLIRLAGVEAPLPSLADRRSATRAAADRLAEADRRALAARVADRDFEMLDLGEDRWGRRLGHLVDTETGHWLEGDLVEEGRLRQRSIPGDPVCAAALLAREAPARAARRGSWGRPETAVLAADRTLLARVGDVVVAEGTVRSIGRSRGRTWLNFGDDIVRDFAVVMNDNDRGRFERAGRPWERLEGRRILIRGLVLRRGDAPRMSLDDPFAIEPVER